MPVTTVFTNVVKGVLLAALFGSLVWSSSGFCTSSQEQFQSVDLSYLASWNGVYPSNWDAMPTDNNANGRPIFADTFVKAILERDMPDHIVDILVNGSWEPGFSGGNVEMPIEIKNNILLISVCKPHDCGAYGILVFLDMGEAEAQAYWLDGDEAQWIGPRQRAMDLGRVEIVDPWEIYARMARQD